MGGWKGSFKGQLYCLFLQGLERDKKEGQEISEGLLFPEEKKKKLFWLQKPNNGKVKTIL